MCARSHAVHGERRARGQVRARRRRQGQVLRAGQCEQYRTYDDKWNPCIAECTKKSAVKVTAAVKAVANIEIKSEEYCNGYDHLRTGETYLLHLSGGTTPGTPI